MKKILALSFLIYISCTHEAQIYKAETLTSDKKKVAIFYNRSGGGHVAAAQVVRESLGSNYEFVNINFSDTYLDKGDFFAWISNGKIGSDFWYNYTLKKGDISLSNFFAKHLLPGLVKRKKELVVKELEKDLGILQPSLVISTIPIVNGYIGEVVQKNNLPFVVTTQDGDVRYFVHGLKDFDYKPFFITVGINGENNKQQLIRGGIKNQQIHKLSHPVRKSFLETQNRENERNKLEIPQDAFTVMILLGATGSDKIINYAKTLIKKHPKVYVIACIGRSHSLRSKLSKYNKNNRLKIIGFTKEIPQLMTASDVLLTKPGPNSVIESLYMNLPMLVDHSSELLLHEQANLDFVVQNNYGREFRSIKELNQFIDSFKARSEKYKTLKQNVLSYEKGDYRIQFKELVEKLLSNHKS